MKMKKHKKKHNTFLNATDSAKYLGVSRQRFYVIRRKYELEHHEMYGLKLFSTLDLMRVRRLLDKWKAAHGQ